MMFIHALYVCIYRVSRRAVFKLPYLTKCKFDIKQYVPKFVSQHRLSEYLSYLISSQMVYNKLMMQRNVLEKQKYRQHSEEAIIISYKLCLELWKD